MVNFQALYFPVSKPNRDDTQHVGRSVYSKFIGWLFLVAALYGGRGSNMGHLWFVIQIWTKWSYKTIFIAWIHYNQQYSILKLEE